LAIVKKIMEDHGGRLSLEDSPAGGALVRLELHGELVDPEDAKDAAPEPAKAAAHGE
jgi:signal transduction histidine kinase